MAESERRFSGHRGGFNHRKRRMRDDDEFGRRAQRRKYDEPPHLKLRKRMLSIAESPLKKVEEEVREISRLVVDGYETEELRTTFLDLVLKLTLEQPFKIPFLAAVLLITNIEKPDLIEEVLKRAGSLLEEYLADGSWREAKLLLRLLACLQGLLDGDGVFVLLEDLFSRAVDLQTASSEDGLGLELVKIILLTIVYMMASSATGLQDRALTLLEKTDIIATTPHTLEALVDPYPGNGDQIVQKPKNVITLLQSQLEAEASQHWQLSCLPRPWQIEDLIESLKAATTHSLPGIRVPSPVISAVYPRLPEAYFSVYNYQSIATVPTENDIASIIIRDSAIDTINLLDYNRNVTAKCLIDLDCFFAPDTFVKRATPFDTLRQIAEKRSKWKPEDVAVDAVFSQLFQLPTPEHKLVYYHSVLTEACKIAPAAIAPSLGRAIRHLYKGLDVMDLELSYRFMDWFSHHLSNFGFTWKWTEWVEDVELPSTCPKKSFMIGALEKEIRLSFAQRIKGTLPEPYQSLLSEAKEKDTPDFKFVAEGAPYASQSRKVLTLLKSKAPDSELQEPIMAIEDAASESGASDPLIISTDVYVTALCYVGSKSLSHVLSCIERCKERLLTIGLTSEIARRQIITSVLDYWSERPGVGVNIVDKLLNYTILTPISVVEWVCIDKFDQGTILTQAYIYEMVASTMFKVTNRVRQIVTARNQTGLPAPQVAMLDETLATELTQMKQLFSILEIALNGILEGNSVLSEMYQIEDEHNGKALQSWSRKWLRVFRRKLKIEETWIDESMTSVAGSLYEG